MTSLHYDVCFLDFWEPGALWKNTGHQLLGQIKKINTLFNLFYKTLWKDNFLKIFWIHLFHPKNILHKWTMTGRGSAASWIQKSLTNKK